MPEVTLDKWYLLFGKAELWENKLSSTHAFILTFFVNLRKPTPPESVMTIRKES